MVSIVIPTKDGSDDLRRCLQAIQAQRLDDPVEIVIVDSGSRDDSVAVAREFGARVVEIAAASFTHGGSRNLGASTAQGEILVFISQDAVPVGDSWLAQLIGPLRSNATLAGTYGRQLARPDATPPEAYFLDFMYGPEPRLQAAVSADDLSMDVTLFSNVNAAIRRSAWERFPFAEDIVMSEDQEWSRRVLLDGYALQYQPTAVVRHSHNYTLTAAFRRFFDSGMSAERAYMAQNSRSGRVLRRRALAYGLGEIGWLWRTNQRAWIPYAVVYETMKMLGLLLGMNHERLPRALRKRFSAIPAAWDEAASQADR